MFTIRIKFYKTGLASYFSHLDLQRVVQRALKKSRLPVWYSLGYNPHIYLTFTLPLSLGHESICESFDFRLTEEMNEKDILNALKDTLPHGITVISAGAPDYEASSIKWAQYRINLNDEKEKCINAINTFSELNEANVEKTTKKKGTTTVNLKEFVKNINIVECENEQFVFTALFSAGIQFNINPNLMLKFLKDNFGISVLDSNILREKLFDENLVILQ